MQHKEIASTRHYAIYAHQVKVVLPMLCPAIARLEGGGELTTVMITQRQQFFSTKCPPPPQKIIITCYLI